MILVYFVYIFALLSFCRNANLGRLWWERQAIMFALAVPTITFCATPLGVIVLYLLLVVTEALVRSLVTGEEVSLCPQNILAAQPIAS